MKDLISLREAMFATLEQLKGENTIDMERVKASTEIYKVIIESAKVEVVYSKLTGNDAPTGFFREEKVIEHEPKQPKTYNGLSDFTRQMGVTTHRIKG